MNAVIMGEAKIGNESIVAASAFVKAKFSCEPRIMVVSAPVKIIRQVTDDEIQWKTTGTQEYIYLTKRCHDSLREVEPLVEIQQERPRFDQSGHRIKKDN